MTVQQSPLPPSLVHLGIIMDGNGRWARAQNKPRTYGHYNGAKAVREAVVGCIENRIQYLTLYGFSTENWRRPKTEIFDLMSLLRKYLRSEIAELHQQGVRLRVIGQRARLDADIVELIEAAEALTAGNTTLTLTLALSYGGRQEIIDAVAKLIAAGQAIEEQSISQALYAPDIPEPDLILRTSGEMRLSNFLLWQAAYSELMVIDTLWPDFRAAHIAEAAAAFGQRVRRFGAVA